MGKAKQAAESSLANLSVPLATMALELSKQNPKWALLVAAGTGLYQVYRELAETRGVELLNFINQHGDKFVDAVIDTPEFKAAFVNVWEMHIRESSTNKRMRLRHFLLNLGSGQKIEPDTHTKIYAVIDQMTDLEAVVFGSLVKASNRPQFRTMHLNSSGIPGLEVYDEAEMQDAWHSLHAYRLINITDATIGNGMVLKQITAFGELFYDGIIREI